MILNRMLCSANQRRCYHAAASGCFVLSQYPSDSVGKQRFDTNQSTFDSSQIGNWLSALPEVCVTDFCRNNLRQRMGRSKF